MAGEKKIKKQHPDTKGVHQSITAMICIQVQVHQNFRSKQTNSSLNHLIPFSVTIGPKMLMLTSFAKTLQTTFKEKKSYHNLHHFNKLESKAPNQNNEQLTLSAEGANFRKATPGIHICFWLSPSEEPSIHHVSQFV